MLSLHYLTWIPSVFCGISGEIDLGKCRLTCQNFCSLEEVFWMLLSEHVSVIPWLITLFLGICLRPFLFIDFFRWLWHKKENRASFTDRAHHKSAQSLPVMGSHEAVALHILHNTDKHNTREVFWSQNAVPDTVTGTICRHDVRMKNTIHKFKFPKSIFSKQLLNIAGVYQNNSLWMK